MPAAVALSTTLDEIAQVTDPYMTPSERLRRNLLYLTRSRTGYTFMQDCGIRMDRRMITAWLAEERHPRLEQQQRLENAFRLLRRRNMAPTMTRRSTPGRDPGRDLPRRPEQGRRQAPAHRPLAAQEHLPLGPHRHGLVAQRPARADPPVARRHHRPRLRLAHVRARHPPRLLGLTPSPTTARDPEPLIDPHRRNASMESPDLEVLTDDDLARRQRARRELMGPAVRALLELSQRGELTTAHVELSAHTLGVHVRTVWRNLARARLGEPLRRSRGRFEITDDIRTLLAYHRGNVKAVHRELVQDAEKAATPVSLSTLHRAVKRDLTPGDRAGLKSGMPASRGHDPHLRRPPTSRNEEWEGDHKQAPVSVWADGRLVKPWVTWFCDCHTGMIMGWAVTPHFPHRGSILAALRSCILRGGTYGPAGGLPARIRIDRGKDFLSRAVQDALGAFAVQVDVLPLHPHLKGSIENLNRAATSMFFSTLPRYTHAQKLGSRRRSGRRTRP
ncbi:hypothetical protein ACFQ3Z_44480 [Streptomyces nogalater]